MKSVSAFYHMILLRSASLQKRSNFLLRIILFPGFLFIKIARLCECFCLDLLGLPVSDKMGCDRGTPIDRIYIEDFLQKHAHCITGDVLEIAENTYTKRYGDPNAKSHVLHVVPGNPEATIIGNMETGENIPENAYDCIILTQTLPFIYDFKSVIENCRKALKPDGTLLLTVPCISHISRYDMDRWGDYWRFTDLAAKRLVEEFFPSEKVFSTIYGNYYAVKSFLAGKSVEDVLKIRLFSVDPDYQMCIAIEAKK